jgi:uncharacterized DUF497 family protein
MRLTEDPATAAWLENLVGVPDEFDWDPGNRTKNRKHGVDAGDVEAMFLSPILFAGRIVEPSHDEPRWLMLGQDASGRSLALIFTIRGRRLRAVSCRSMRPKEKKLYEEVIGNVDFV